MSVKRMLRINTTLRTLMTECISYETHQLALDTILELRMLTTRKCFLCLTPQLYRFICWFIDHQCSETWVYNRLMRVITRERIKSNNKTRLYYSFEGRLEKFGLQGPPASVRKFFRT